jgi:hypothetical protein
MHEYGASVLEVGNACKVLVDKPERRRPLGRPRRKWQDTPEIGCALLAWIHQGNKILDFIKENEFSQFCFQTQVLIERTTWDIFKRELK